MKFYRWFWFQWLLALVICTLVRLPYFLGNHVSFDGDEAIVGIMAQDLLAGRNIPVYFYGQQYGFSFFELLGSAIGILLFGNTVWAIKLGGLLVFSLGVSFLFRFFLKKGIGFWWALGGMLLIAMFPAWMVWAAKARGGYVTAFTAVCLLLYLCQLKEAGLRWLMLAACILAVALHAQIFIALAGCFLWVQWVLRSKKVSVVFLACAGVVVFYIVLKIPAFLNEAYWPAPLSLTYNKAAILPLLKQSWQVALGYFYYELTFTPPASSFWLGLLYYLLTLGLIIYGWVKEEWKVRLGMILIFVGAMVSFFLIMWMRVPTCRYLLGGLTAMLLMFALAYVQVFNFQKKGRLILVPGLLLALGFSFSSRHIPDSWMLPKANDMTLYNELVTTLHQRNIHHVFCLDPLVQWQLNYTGLAARYTSPTERINRYVLGVNGCYSDSTCKTAVVGYTGFYNGLDTFERTPNQLVLVNDKFFIFEKPDSVQLSTAGFEF
jgi:hypothetical protein